jgi:hypothetical protein
MYWRGEPLFGLEQVSAFQSLRKQPKRDNALVAVLAEMAKYLGITATIYLAILAAVSVL